MADGSAPDITQQLLQMQSLINASRGNGKPSFAFGVLPMEWNAVGGLGAQALAPLGKNVPTLMQGTGKAGGMGDKLLQAMAAITEDCKKIAQGAGVMYSGNVTNGAPDSGLGRNFGSNNGTFLS